MGTMNFQLPPAVEEEAVQELGKGYVIGGPDNMPWLTDVRVAAGWLQVCRHVEESGSLAIPWEVEGAGRLMGTTATLIERPTPYPLQLELARGKTNQLRGQAHDWQAGGLQVPEALGRQIRQTNLSFCKAVTRSPSDAAGPLAQECLVRGYEAADQLAHQYIEQMFQARHHRHPRLDTVLGCSLGPTGLSGHRTEALVQACNSVRLNMTWKDVERAEASFQWETYDGLLDWALGQGLAVTAGPLIDFSPERLPDWLAPWKQDLSSVASFMCDYVETAVRRYRGRVHSWQLATAANLVSVPGWGEEELTWLIVRLAEVARQVDPKLVLIVGIAQPWGEYLAREERIHSPFIFADNLVRSGLHPGALDLELVMGILPRGSYCRDLLETSRLLDLYSVLGVPLRVTLGYPSAEDNDSQVQGKYLVGAGRWHSGFNPTAQAEWADAYAALALCKPTVRGVHWVHLADAEAHQFPHCGLFDAQDRPKPVIQSLRELRENHLR